ncbi:hypothetical protein BABINDRAFT_162533 [Babjeviella inositovora NRRL Y-12698]|uniref:Acyl carrier protein n=1 Tax=Babjeviella inositovora NRRL Y-12698 TaxID=984486 RepID=A0A1E3QMK1_9ASCO|nr:uncharacterized protein BABINDRAFT_162533 [Babjeviella inositovora NRRL Y-12698]ODQ78860.1 hypothetical protein BABINDRAFT_162533 [Babjeviella inositovora NRRL Y-12698]
MFRLAAASTFRAVRPVVRAQPTVVSAFRFYAAEALTKEAVSTRVLQVVKNFDGVKAAEITAASSFTKDLGLDSLDTVDLLVSIEEEFDIEIPDKIADELKTVGQTIDYVAEQPNAA